MQRILSLDGGGIRGAFTARILEHIEEQRPGFIAQSHLIVGTSTGGLIALALRAGVTPRDLTRMYVERGAEIFADSFGDDIRDVGMLLGAQYSSDGLISVAKDVLGEQTRLRDLSGPVAVTTFEMDSVDAAGNRTWKPWIIHNLPGSDSDADVLAWKAAVSTSSAPTFFPTFEGNIDGGVFANNPSMVGVAQAMDPRGAAPAALDQIELFSIGTGQKPNYVPGQTLDWGLRQWARPLVDIMIDGVSGVVDQQCRMMLGDRYARLNPVLPPQLRVSLDQVLSVREMVAWADFVAKSADFASFVAKIPEAKESPALSGSAAAAMPTPAAARPSIIDGLRRKLPPPRP